MKRHVFVTLALVFVLGLLAGELLPGKLLESAGHAEIAAEEPARPLEPLPDDLTPEETRNIKIFRGASASVVNITTVVEYRDFFLNEFEIPKGSGAGFFWDGSLNRG